MRIIYAVVISLIVAACTSSPKGHVYRISNKPLDFVKSREYTFSTSKSAIPAHVLDSLSSIHGEAFTIGDSSDVGRINLTDLWMNDGLQQYSRKLTFVLVGDTACIVVYLQGGVGVHDVVEYVQYGRTFMHKHYTTLLKSEDTTKLREYLEGGPKPVEKYIPDDSVADPGQLPLRDTIARVLGV